MKYLIFQHVPNEPIGLIGEVLKKQKIQTKIIEFFKKDWKIPEDLSEFDGLIIMGGPMGVYEGPEVFPSKEEEVGVINKFLKNKKPIIGFCLGSQLLAYSQGGSVYPNCRLGKRIKEIGYYTVDLTEEGKVDPILKGFSSPMEVTQWHGDAFDIPKGGIKLASSPLCDNQAFRFGKNAYGFLFHFELSPDLIENLIRIDNKWIHEDFDMDEKEFLKQAEEKKDLMREQCERLFENFKILAQNSK